MYNRIEDDAELIRLVKDGECEAFGPLIDRYKLALYKVMYRMVLNRDDAEDLVEEAFIKAYRSIRKFEIGRPFYAWLRRIAVNNAINFLKKQRASQTDPLEYVTRRFANGKNDPVAMTEHKLLQERLEKAMARLPREFRIILSLKVVFTSTASMFVDSGLYLSYISLILCSCSRRLNLSLNRSTTYILW